MITFRPMEHKDDRKFVISSWSTSYRTSYSAGIIDMEHWPEVMHAQIERYLDRPNTRTILAVEDDDPMFFYGFASVDTTPQLEHQEYGATKEWPALVYYAFVKLDYRRRKIARRTLAAAGVDMGSRFLYVCKTPMSARLAPKMPLAKWNALHARFSDRKDTGP